MIEREPTIVSATIGKSHPFLGIVWFYEEDVELNIIVHRERWAEHLAFVGGLNLFWIMIFHCIFKCCTRNQFHASLRKEINPNVVRNADQQLLGNPISNFRRKYMSDTVFGLSSSEELMLDNELSSHLSYKNMFQTSKLVQQQQVIIQN